MKQRSKSLNDITSNSTSIDFLSLLDPKSYSSKRNHLHDRDIENLRSRGQELYQTNEFYRDLAFVVTHPEMRRIFKKLRGNDMEASVFVKTLDLYHSIESRMSSEEPYVILAMIKDIIHNHHTRRKLLGTAMDRMLLIQQHLITLEMEKD